MISVAIASYNGELYIKEQIQSILYQTLPVSEIIIVDDCSSDSTTKVIRNMLKLDDRIKLVVNNKNQGHIKSFERALSLCSGSYIFLSDQDDIWLPGKVKTCIDYLDKYNLSAVYHDAQFVNSSLTQFLGSKFYHMKRINIPQSRFCMGSCLAFRRHILDLALPFPPYISGHDNWIDFCIKSLYRDKYAYIDNQLILYRRHLFNQSVGIWNNPTISFISALLIRIKASLSLSLSNKIVNKGYRIFHLKILASRVPFSERSRLDLTKESQDYFAIITSKTRFPFKLFSNRQANRNI